MLYLDSTNGQWNASTIILFNPAYPRQPKQGVLRFVKMVQAPYYTTTKHSKQAYTHTSLGSQSTCTRGAGLVLHYTSRKRRNRLRTEDVTSVDDRMTNTL